jgi:3',5'-cyclic AMP phosphodiesterase CpdA
VSPDRRPTAARRLSRGDPLAADQLLRRRSIAPSGAFAALPDPVGPFPYRRELEDVLDPAAAQDIRARGRLRFHALGDTGGWTDGSPQHRVAAALAEEQAGEDRADFLYHLGDVVYPHGEESHYATQFFAPYSAYDAPIFAIPGNHDGEAGFPRARTLDPFMAVFGDSGRHLRDAALAVPRPPARQPHVHWTLVHDWLWVIGLYSNVHEDGEVAEEQLDWLRHELAAAPRDALVAVAVHRPVFSADVLHGSNLALGDALDDCFDRSGRWPELVLSAHAHCYQRFTRRLGGRRLPYLVAGAGGFHERHRLGAGAGPAPSRFAALPELTLDAAADDAHGYLTIDVGPAGLAGRYQTVGKDGPQLRDAFTITRG